MFTGKTASDIFDHIRHLVQSGGLRPGEVLPPVRELASQLEVNRNTVAAAYKRLVTSGLAVSQGRNGTAIKARDPLPALEGGDPTTPLNDISSGNPDPARLPELTRYLGQLARTPRLYGDAPIEPRLGQWAEAWFAKEIAVPFAVNLASGAIDALERLLSALLLPGDGVVVEDPCFLSSINMVRYAGFTPCPVAVDALTETRAHALREVLARYPQVLAIVDDHFALLSATPWHSPLPASTQRWALVRSMSKTLGPDLRLAFIASDADTSAALRQRLNAGSQWVSHLLQDLTLACLTDEAFIASMTETRRHYRQQNEKLAAALARHGHSHATPGDGLNFWLPLPAASQPYALRLARAGWLVREGEIFGVRTPAHGLRLSLGRLSDAEISRLAADIALVLNQP
ncbi:MAG: aminotransferase class I/II-fold pyridoxal phosphate-dependent enzyme [Klebsiella sp.]|uniref:aminotransferase class I/II-fold pyridoxal phosphate-dependent enzyme n=1 Tax=Klebsiella sp. TaxID=576 RepID=UPI002913F7D0|nr:aminotransferase class I/II-fold pyridoxal phosphate-dependent enzyme [Klebsiella sp.]MDU3363081.1 aminotransferase class I/II-fold pyridoxal phosphate-dependent enzyme [Klebsiella sp.]